MPSKEFGQLLKGAINSIAMYDNTNAPVIEDQLGALIGVSGATIQRYKSGHIPPETRTVQILAEAAIKRSYLNREWLQKFLHAARYPGPEKLVDQLCPPETVRKRLPRVYENLPAPIYSQFVMREQVFAEIVEGLNRRSAVVLLASLGGMGKTSLAREIAARCLQGGSDVPQFDAAVWVSDKDRPGTTTLSTVLDTIAQTLDFPGFIQFAHDEKQYEVEQLLRRQRVLLIIDNAETITDGVLLKWILRQLPAPSKALVTAREYRREFRDGAIPIELRGMNDGEAIELIAERLVVLKMDKAVRDLDQLEPLIRVTGGNPKAIEMAMGLLKYQRQPLQQIIDDFYAARGNLFDDLFARAWSLLDEAARRILLVTPLFIDSASEEALATVADVHGFACTRAVEQLADLALLDVQQSDLGRPVRYTTHRLVRAFAGSKLSERKTFENEARERWVDWAFTIIGQIGNCFSDNPQFEIMDFDYRTCFAAIEWAAYHSDRTYMFARLDRSECYYTIRGHWDTMKSIYMLWTKAAQRLLNLVEEFRGIAAYLDMALAQFDISEAEGILSKTAGSGRWLHGDTRPLGQSLG
jgi:transcriptional regulator with XRE-family HTH domain